MNKTILIIDDDKVLCDSLAKGLRQNGFSTVTAASADAAMHIMDRMSFDAMVLDRMMPGTDGLTALRHWRARGIAMPVIMLTAMGGAENSIAGLSGGADDYLAKPFALKELVLRLKNIMDRAPSPLPALPSGLKFENGEFFVNTQPLSLSAAEKELLAALVAPVGTHVVAAPMVAKRLREKLLAPLPGLDIITVRGKGYKLIARQGL